MVECVPSSADVSARAVTMLSPDIVKKPLVSLEVNVPVNWEPSDIVTVAVESTVPAGALSGVVALAGESVIAVGVGTGGGGGGGGGDEIGTAENTDPAAAVCSVPELSLRKFPVRLFRIVYPEPLETTTQVSPVGFSVTVPSPASAMNGPSPGVLLPPAATWLLLNLDPSQVHI